MAAVKRKAPSVAATADVKRQKSSKVHPGKPAKRVQLEHFPESDESEGDEPKDKTAVSEKPRRSVSVGGVAVQSDTDGDSKFKLETSSAEAHAKQRALAKERKSNKPNADAIARSKQLWERLRRKSHVPLEERKKLVSELFDLVNGRVRDFVFKHDSVRVIQCALKYANQEQRKSITKELQSDIRTLAESRYGKFLVAKMISAGDEGTRDMVVPEFYGHVRRLVNHPEASWIVDDIYRQIATPEQKATMLREWYGAEFALFHRKPTANATVPMKSHDTAELSEILQANPEKRNPILQYLHQMINSLIQKKMTGFTMLHDAMLQYFLALTPGGEEQSAFLEEMIGDVDKEAEGGGGDLYKNLAFTKSGSRLVCLAMAYGTSKDRKVILRVFKDTIEMMALDQYAKMVLVVGLDVPDDTQMTTKAIYRELFAEKLEDQTERMDKLEALVTDLNARTPVLYPMGGITKWIFPNERDRLLLEEVHAIRETTSKKAPATRRAQLLEYSAEILLRLVSERAASLAKTSFGWQFISEALLELHGPEREKAKSVVAQLAAGDPGSGEHIAGDAAAGRTLKTLVLGGRFDAKDKKVSLSEPRLGFGETLWQVIKDHGAGWACSSSSFVMLALLESEDVPEAVKGEVKVVLRKGEKRLKEAAKNGAKTAGTSDGGDAKKKAVFTGNPGARLLLERLH